MNPPRVVILGGGFAGLNAARKLKRAPVEVVLVDRENYPLFQPLLYQVATAVLSESDIAFPLRSALRRQKNARVVRLVEGEPTKPFEYLDKGALATIGRAAGVLEFGKIRLSGFLAWMAWLVIHIVYLIGFRNRVWVLAGWIWSFSTARRGPRLIMGRRTDGASLPPVED